MEGLGSLCQRSLMPEDPGCKLYGFLGRCSLNSGADRSAISDRAADPALPSLDIQREPH